MHNPECKVRLASREECLLNSLRLLLFQSDKDVTPSSIESAGGPTRNWTGHKKYPTQESLLELLVEKVKHVELARIREQLNQLHGKKEPSADLKLKRLILAMMGWKKDFQRENSIWSYQPNHRTSYFCETLKRKVASFLVADVFGMLEHLMCNRLDLKNAVSNEILNFRARSFFNFLLGASGDQFRILSDGTLKAEHLVGNLNCVLEVCRGILCLRDSAFEPVVMTESKRKRIQLFIKNGFKTEFLPAISYKENRQAASKPDVRFPCP